MGLWKDKIRKDWRYSFQYRGKTYAGGGFKTRRAAGAERAKRRESVRKTQKTLTGTDFLTVSNRYLDDAERRFAKITYKYKRRVYKMFLKETGNRPMNQYTPQDISIYLLALPSNCLYNAHRKDISTLFNYAKRSLKIDLHNPCAEIEKMPHNPKDKEIPTEEEIIKLILAADHQADEQDLILTVIHTMGRIDEILRLQWTRDVNFDKRIVTLWTRKRKGGEYEPDDIPMSQDLYDVLMKRWKERTQDRWVFFNEETGDRFNHRPKLMKGLCKRAGVKHYGFHALRHFMASYHHDKLKTGVSAISKLLRHKSKRTTEIYLHTIDESVRSAIAQQDGKFTPKMSNPQASPASMEDEDAL